MDDLATLTGQPQKFVVNDKTYELYPLDFGDFGKLQKWVDEQFPDPFEIVGKAIANGNYTVAQQQFMLRTAMEEARKPKAKIGTYEADSLLMTMDGYKQILLLSVRKGNPEFTEKEAEELFRAMSAADLAKVSNATTINMVLTDPKEEPLDVRPPSKPSGPAASRRRAKKQK